MTALRGAILPPARPKPGWATPGPLVSVVNVVTGATRLYSRLTPEQAVIAAYAHTKPDRRDWKTWTFAEFAPLVHRGVVSVACGEWATMEEVR